MGDDDSSSGFLSPAESAKSLALASSSESSGPDEQFLQSDFIAEEDGDRDGFLSIEDFTLGCFSVSSF